MSVLEPRIRRTRDGAYELGIPADQREVLRTLPGQLRELLAEGDREADPALRRLFPVADPEDAEHAAEFDRLVHDDLVAQRMAAIEAMERTIDADRISEDDLLGWLGAMNDLRLILGTRLGVTEGTTVEDFEGDESKTAGYALYAYLSYLEEQIVAALSEG